ncbi:MAG: hypothetical protein U5O39_20825 [Gammaproteobacteria bacterium]|nr:hypothetical protein [Gammaproteobacteria bacterium]
MNKPSHSIRQYTIALLAIVFFVPALAAVGPFPVGGPPQGEPVWPPTCQNCVGPQPPSRSQSDVAGGPRLLASDITTVIARAVHQARALDAVATIAVVDRVGNVLAVYRMDGDNPDVRIATTGPDETAVDGGLEGIELPAGVGGDALAAIAKAITGAYLSTSDGNAFTTRTANQIVQEHFNPGEFNQPSGPLFGVQFSQLACSDFTLAFDGRIRRPRSAAFTPGTVG